MPFENSVPHTTDHEKAREFQKNIYSCFIGYAKAFDCADHSKLWRFVKKMGIPDHLTCLLRTLYAGKEATVRTGHDTTDWFQIRKGVRQAVHCHPACFTYMHHEKCWAGGSTSWNHQDCWENINKLRYADDTTLMAESEEELKRFDESEKE